MFGFSLTKLLVLAAIVAAVWYGFKWVTRMQRLREQAKEEPKVAAEDTVRCPKCDAYVVAKGAADCGRPGCPYAPAGPQ